MLIITIEKPVKMKKILFILPSFKIGGTNTAFNNLLSKIKNNYDIDVFAIDNSGPNFEFVSKNAHIIGVSTKRHNTGDKIDVVSNLKSFAKVIKRFVERLGIDISPLFFKSTASLLSKNNYDIVIGDQEGQATRLLKYIKAKKKVAWVHCDFSRRMNTKLYKKERGYYDDVDKIVCVSKFTASEFQKCLPNVAHKVTYLHNALEVNSILSKSKDQVDDVRFLNQVFTIISVGRIDPVKRFDKIPEIASKMKEYGVAFKWYILGNGSNENISKLTHSISQYSVEDCVITLGAKTNPYPYIANSSILVSTSSSEACPTVINEAKILGIPVVSADYGSAREFIGDNEFGIVCPLSDMADSITKLISDRILYNHYREVLRHYTYENDEILNKLYNEIF